MSALHGQIAGAARVWLYERTYADLPVTPGEFADRLMPTVQAAIDAAVAQALEEAAAVVAHSPGIKHQAKAVNALRARAAARNGDQR